MKNKPLILLISLLGLFACKTPKIVQTSTDDGQIDLTFLQINDVYEIAPLEGGKIGGMARIATLRKTLTIENKNTLTVHAGDFLNPSLIGTIRYEGNSIKGRQMIETMNYTGIDLVAFGNHEFDLDEDDLQQRLNESEFEWLATNLQQRCGDRLYPFYRERNGNKHFFPEHYVWEISDADGTTAKIGILSACINSNPKDYVVYEDYFTEAMNAYKTLEQKCDFVIGLTHLNMEDDIKMAKHIPQLKLIMGGHEHDNIKELIGNTIITKADANAKSAYIHRLSFNKKTKQVDIKSELKIIDESIAMDTEVDQVVQKWNGILMRKIQEIIPNPSEVIYQATTPLDGRESSIRNMQTNLGDIFTSGMLQASKKNAVCAFMNSGSVRIDDQISGAITPIDIFRALPYGGQILEVEMKGDYLVEVLTMGKESKGKGAYLQIKNLNFDEDQNKWMIQNKPINSTQNYIVAMNDFLLRGLDISILTADAAGIINIFEPEANDPSDARKDIRLAAINFMKSQ